MFGTKSLVSITVGIVAAQLLHVGWSASAWACSPGPSQVHEIWPADGETLPANAAIVFIGDSLHTHGGFEVDPLQATVNGQPASISIDDTLSLFHGAVDSYTVLAVRVDPTPVPGDVVDITGTPCAFESCPSLAYQVTVGEPDQIPPTGVSELWWDFVYSGTTVPNPDLPDSCGGHTPTGYFDISASFDSPIPAGERWFAHLRVVPDQGGPGDPWQYKWYLSTESIDRQIRFQYDEIPVYTSPTGYCVRLSVYDMAGNTVGTREQCLPCRTAASVIDGIPDYQFYPGGDCAEGVGGGVDAGPGIADAGAADAGNAPDTGGCSIADRTSSTQWLVLVLLVLLMTRQARPGVFRGRARRRSV